MTNNMPAVDRFTGGPLDGHQEPITPHLTTHRYDPTTGAHYTLTSETNEHREWTHTPTTAAPLQAVAVHRDTGHKQVTLRQLEHLIHAARQHGYQDNAEPLFQITLRGHLKSIGFTPPRD